METVSGLTNWRLVVRRETDSVTILRALTCDREAVLPDTLFGLPVTALSDRCLAAGAAPAAGEEVRVLGGAEGPDWDNRGITTLRLPRELKSVGDYAFMNLRAMETLHFYDRVETLGSESFMNCRAFQKITLQRVGPDQGPALANLIYSLPRELDVTVRKADGSILRLIFPEYLENYTENSPAHHFELKIVGGGYAYHGVFRAKKLSVPAYDALWPGYLAAEHDEMSALRLSYSRLRWPAELSERAESQYAAYLREHLPEALSFVIRERDAAGLRMLLALAEPDEDVLERALGEARDRRQTEAVALLLEKQRGREGRGRRKKFEL